MISMLVSNTMRDDYNDYLSQHISNVKKGFEWIVKNLPELVENYDVDYLRFLMKKHDKSKYSPEEYDSYCVYFYGEKTPEVEEEFDKAWLHHQHANPHHWQHWLLQEDDGDLKAVEMPHEFVLEMLCDHWAFSWQKDNLFEIFDWYKSNKSKMNLHEDTRRLYEEMLDKLKAVLERKKEERFND